MLGSWSAVTRIPDEAYHSPAGPAQASAIRAQVSFLHLVLSSNWLILLTRTSGRFWAHTQCWQVVLTILSIGLGATVLCSLGYVGGGHIMSIGAVCRVWVYSSGTVCVAAGLLCHLVKEPLTERQISGKKGLSSRREGGKWVRKVRVQVRDNTLETLCTCLLQYPIGISWVPYLYW